MEKSLSNPGIPVFDVYIGHSLTCLSTGVAFLQHTMIDHVEANGDGPVPCPASAWTLTCCC